MSSLKNLKLFTTQPHPCSYLPDREARTLFLDPELEVSQELHTYLSEMGFRRSGLHMYRPHCDHCQSCIACRVVVDAFLPNRRFRRILKKNTDLEISRVDSIDSPEFYALYANYINHRHHDGDMYPASRDQYESFLANTCETTEYFAARDPQGRLLSVMVSDLLANALSAVYTFFAVDEAKRSLGNFCILWQIHEAQRLGLPYLYLGYWIRNCDKMNYKTQFRPLEMLVNGHWILFD